MDEKLIANDRLPEWLAGLSGEYDVYAPAREDGLVLLRRFAVGVGWPDRYANFVLPPKHMFFPQTEKLFGFSYDGKLTLHGVETGGRPRLIYGIRPCDVESLALLDVVFGGDQPDPYYLGRRTETLLIAAPCGSPRRSCFCTSMGIDPGKAPGADVLSTDVGGRTVLRPGSARGRQLLEKWGAMLSAAPRADVRAAAELEAGAKEMVTCRLDVQGVDERLRRAFDSDYWREIAEKCLGCGVCSYTCPTCHCFDIADEKLGAQGQRFRCWDCCMFSDFTRIAGGHNPRPTKRERVRQRFLHKLAYFFERYGRLACVGCGRCVDNCPVNMDIRDVISDVKGECVRHV